MSQREQAELADIGALLVDLDGVVWIDGRPIAGSVAALQALVGNGVQIVYVTNDPRSSPEQYARRLAAIGAPAHPNLIVTSGRALAALAREYVGPGRVLVIGTAALKAEFSRQGMTVVGPDADAEAVAIGGHDGFDFRELRAAVRCVRDGARLLAAGRDPTYPARDGLSPGTGAIVAAVEYATGASAVVAGKPERALFESALSRIPSRAVTAIVGDTLTSDIQGGQRCGLVTILVLTGNAGSQGLGAAPIAPDYVLPDLAAVSEQLVRARRRPADSAD